MLLLHFSALAYAADAPAPSFSFWQMWLDAGPVAKCVIVILGCMLLATIVTGIERLIAFNRARSQSMRVAAEIVGSLRQNDVGAARKLTGDERFKASYLAAILRAGLTEVESRPDRHGLAAAERAVLKTTNQEMAKLRRGMTILATVGSTAPFVGLFGTTFGVINAFQGMATAGSGLANISAGISEALITTAFGIAVAVVGVWLFNYFNQRLDKVAEELASSEADFVDWAEKMLLARAEPALEAGK